MIRTILIPLDGSAFSEHALPLGKEFACALHARLVLVCVANGEMIRKSGLNDADRKEMAEKYAGVREEDHLLSTEPRMVERAQSQVRVIAEAEQYLQAVASRTIEPGIQVELAIPYGETVEGILTEVEVHGADMVIMAYHDRTRVSHLILNSVAISVLSRSPVPVLFVPTAQE